MEWKLTGSQLFKKFPAFYGPQRFTASFTNARHLHLPLQNIQKLQMLQSLSVHPSAQDQVTSTLNIRIICQIALLYLLRSVQTY
jgi:hypothetical protein